jgi:hypothetical protein
MRVRQARRLAGGRKYILLLFAVPALCGICCVIGNLVMPLCSTGTTTEAHSPDSRYVATVRITSCYMSPHDYSVVLSLVDETEPLGPRPDHPTVFWMMTTGWGPTITWADPRHLVIEYGGYGVDCSYVRGRVREWRDIVVSHSGPCEPSDIGTAPSCGPDDKVVRSG